MKAIFLPLFIGITSLSVLFLSAAEPSTAVGLLQDWQPTDTTPPPPVPEKMLRATQDPHVAAFIIQNPRPQEIGKIKDTSDGREQLILNGKKVFEALRIKSRSISPQGFLAIEAILGELPAHGEKGTPTEPLGKLLSSPHEIWLVTPDGSSKKLTPPHLHASAPIISPNNKYVAYTVDSFTGQDIVSSQRLYVMNLETQEVRHFGPEQPPQDYNIRAIDWHHNSTVIRALENWGEGGHIKFKQVRLEP